MATRIDNLKTGQEVTLKLYSDSTHFEEEQHEFVKIAGAGEKRTAAFIDCKTGQVWEVYRFKGRWVYGSSADRVSLA